ncbi:MAG TPA: hypothetical protein VGL70_06515, partial [Candidatus Binatia bacterium]
MGNKKKEKQTLADRWVATLKNTRLVTIALVATMIIAGVASFTDNFMKIKDFILEWSSSNSPKEPPASVSQSTFNSPGSVQVGRDLIISNNPADQPRVQPKVELPDIIFSTRKGLPISSGAGSSWSHEDQAKLRYHGIAIRNRNRLDLSDVVARVQLPEPILRTVSIERPAGVEVLWDADWPQMIGLGAVTTSETVRLTGIWKLKIERLPAEAEVNITFLTTNGLEATNYLSTQKRQDDTKAVRYFLNGTFNYLVDSHPTSREVYVIIDADPIKRSLVSQPPRATKG